LPCH
jgi:hypothetical protein